MVDSAAVATALESQAMAAERVAERVVRQATAVEVARSRWGPSRP